MLWRSNPPTRRPAGFIEPCLPTLAEAVPSGAQWAYEIKHDGLRTTENRLLAEGVGFEPTSDLRHCRFSRPVP